jgi:hypothetical protein
MPPAHRGSFDRKGISKLRAASMTQVMSYFLTGQGLYRNLYLLKLGLEE